MKKIVAFGVVVCAVTCLLMLGTKRVRQLRSQSKAGVQTTEHVSSAASRDVPRTATLNKESLEEQQGLRIPALSERSRMTEEERLRVLEGIGFLPDDSDSGDWALAEKTSWWGRRLDPREFWSDKVVWYDRVSEREARRRGRGYPPMPYVDPSLGDRSDEDTRADTFQIEGPNIHFVSSEREAVFWNQFIKTHPHPPDDITSWLQERATSWLRRQNILDHDPTYAARLGLAPKSMGEVLESDARDARVFGYPPEFQTPDVYRWSHIMQKRQEYETIRAGGQETDNVTISNFFRRVYVDHKYITEPLSADDIRAANAWKLPYLRRLRQEKADESYISAYMQAWNLSSNEVWSVSQ